MTTLYPCRRASRSAPTMNRLRLWSLKSLATRPTSRVLRMTRLRACRFGTYPNSLATRRIRVRVTADTEPLPFKTLLVVWKLTPDLAATSLTETCLVDPWVLTFGYYDPSRSERSPREERPRSAR